MAVQQSSNGAVAPDTSCPHWCVAEHLKKVACLDLHLRAVIDRHATIARVRHSVVESLCKQLKAPIAESVSLGEILRCLRKCRDNDVVPPVFLVDFRETVLQRWSSEIIVKARNGGGRQWSLADREALMWSLRDLLDAGMCHRQHVSVVDQGRNPSWLAEYVRCVRLIWRENGGKSTPETMQYLRKLGCCTSECVSLISAYTALCLDGSKTMQVYRDLSKMQRVVFSSYTSGGMSNTAAFECIQQLEFEPSVLASLSEVEEILTEIWDTITNPHSDEDRCIAIPGIKGSHVEKFMLPRRVVVSGTPALIINCINSALPLCRLNPAADHDVLISSSHPGVKRLCQGVAMCVNSMLETCPFRANGACDPAWLDTYLDLTRAVLRKVCLDTGVSTQEPTRTSPNTACELDHLPGIPMSTVVERDAYRKSGVRKVQIAGNLFDSIVLNIKHCKAKKTTRFREISIVWDSKTHGYKNDVSVAGRFLSDMNRILLARDLSTEVRIDVADRSISYSSESSAIKCLGLLVEYMREFSKSRRRRKDTLMLKRNSIPDDDKRRGAKKRARTED